MDLPERRFQVFISSTFRDLEVERQKVLQAVLELKAFPSGMEMFPSADEEQWEFIKREIDSSDYYVVIIAGKYGSVAPDGISYTEKEYDYAIQSAKPVHAFLCKSLGDLKGSQLEDDPARREHLLNFRKKAAANKLVKYYANPDELKAQVLQALMTAFNGKPQEGWVRARYTRRMEDLEQINDLQKRIRELEIENARLQLHDSTARLAQEGDTFEKAFRLTPTDRPVRSPDGISRVKVEPPIGEIAITTTWDEVLLALFPGGLAAPSPMGPQDRLLTLLKHKLLLQFPDSAAWTGSAEVHNFDIVQFEAFKSNIRLQLLGLGLIDVVAEEKVGLGVGGLRAIWEGWTLTHKGRLRCALIAGHRRVMEQTSADD